jgi:fluoride exporter
VTLLLVLLGGALGALARYLADQAIGARTAESSFPWGILAVNVAGSCLAGAILGYQETAGGPAWVPVLLGTGFCGALTTFSTFGVQTVVLVEEGRARVAVVNAAFSIGAGVLACTIGWAAGQALGGLVGA